MAVYAIYSYEIQEGNKYLSNLNNSTLIYTSFNGRTNKQRRFTSFPDSKNTADLAF